MTVCVIEFRFFVASFVVNLISLVRFSLFTYVDTVIQSRKIFIRVGTKSII